MRKKYVVKAMMLVALLATLWVSNSVAASNVTLKCEGGPSNCTDNGCAASGGVCSEQCGCVF